MKSSTSWGSQAIYMPTGGLEKQQSTFLMPYMSLHGSPVKTLLKLAPIFILFPNNNIKWRRKKVKLETFCGRSDRAKGLFTVRFETEADTLTGLQQGRKKKNLLAL